MSAETEAIRLELPHVARIINRECRLESLRRGCPVDRKDPAIRLRVADILLSGAGARLRRELMI